VCSGGLGRPGGSIGYEFWFARHRRSGGQIREIAPRMITLASLLASGMAWSLEEDRPAGVERIAFRCKLRTRRGPSALPACGGK
jgi:hypothetical protein